MIGLSTALRAEAAGLGVKASVACPGPIRTGMQKATTLVTPLIHEEALRAELRGSGVGMDADRCARAILRGVERDRVIYETGTPDARADL